MSQVDMAGGVGSLSVNQIGALIASYFGSAPIGVYGHLGDGGKPIKDPAVVEWLDTAIAICLAESRGNPKAKNPKSSASGLWQIMVSVHGKEIADAIKWIEADTESDGLTIFDPRVNTAVADHVYANAGKKWTPWETYTSGAYKKYKGHGNKVWDYLNNATNIQAGIDKLGNEIAYGDMMTGVAALAANPLVGGISATSLPDWTSAMFKFVKDAALPIGVFLVALVLLVMGIVFLISGSKTAQSVAKVAIP